MMFCPLCKSEYRNGFTECSDCRLALRETRDEAEAVPVELIWEGSSRIDFERVLDALANVNVTYKFKERVKSNPWPWLIMMLFRSLASQSTFQYEIWILEKDADLARAAITGTHKQDLNSDE